MDLKRRDLKIVMWDLIRISCIRVISNMSVLKVSIEGYVDDYYKKETFMKGYSFMSNLVPSEHL